MNQTELIELMHAVLDGEANAAQKRELDRRLASDPAARAEFDALRGIFDALQTIAPASAPEGLVASVMADLPAHQLSSSPRVIGPRTNESEHTNTVRRPTRSWPLPGSTRMSDQHSGSKRKGLWIGVGVAALAVVIVASSGIDFPPGGTSTSGAIVPAQRFRADQPATTGVNQVGQPDAQRAAQPTPGNAGDARSSDGRVSDSMKSDGRVSDGMKSDGRVNDSMKSDGRVSDGMKSDGRVSDSMKSDGRVSDSMKSDGRVSDSMKSDGRTGDSRVSR